MMRLIIIFLLIFSSIYGKSQRIGQYDFGKLFKELGLNKKYQVISYLSGYVWLFEDFNKDFKTDCAILIREKSSEKEGILLIHGGTNEFFIFGAGKKFGNGSDDFKWANHWEIYNKKLAYETRVNKQGDLIGARKLILKRPGILIEQFEMGEPIAGGIIYWNGKKYIWIQQGE